MSHEILPRNERIPAEVWAQTPDIVRREMVALVEELNQVKARLAKLEEQLRRNSYNSSQPPSQDKPGQKPPTEVEKIHGKRRRGGQVGHVGRSRPLLPVAVVDEVIMHRPERCGQCGALLLGQDATPYRYQVTELPRVTAHVTEHQVHRLHCLCCGAETRGQLPAEIAASQFGPNMVSLMGCYRLSKRQVVDLLVNCFGIPLAASTVVNQQQVISEALAQPVDELAASG